MITPVAPLCETISPTRAATPVAEISHRYLGSYRLNAGYSRCSVLLLVTLTTVLASAWTFAAETITKNGFLLEPSTISSGDILSGGPPRDGIPAIHHPEFIPANDADYLEDKDRILGIVIDGIARAYPIAILNWHEIVNDRIGNTAFAVTYCPLCGTGVAFSANVDGTDLRFGVSGLLYNSDVLLYDSATESLWSQILSRAVTGPYINTPLKRIALTHTSWAAWQTRHPETRVLSTNTGFSRDYTRNPYADYEKSRALYFKVSQQAPENYHPKERVLGLLINDVHKAYPFVELNKVDSNKPDILRITDQVNNETVTILWDKAQQSGQILNAAGDTIPHIEGFWFAWFSFYPDTEVFTAASRP